MKETFIFKLKNDDEIFNYKFLSKIEEKEFKHLSDKEVTYLLKWINDRIISHLPKELDTLEGCCGYAADLLDILLDSLNIKHYPININHLLKEDKLVHVITIISILKDDNKYHKYVLDPTFRQFLQMNRCLPNKRVIFPGYFLSLSKEKEEFAKSLLNNGYFYLDKNNLKIYTDAFINYNNTCNLKDINYNIKHSDIYMKELANCIPHEVYPLDYKIKNKLQLTPKQIKMSQK